MPCQARAVALGIGAQRGLEVNPGQQRVRRGRVDWHFVRFGEQVQAGEDVADVTLDGPRAQDETASAPSRPS